MKLFIILTMIAIGSSASARDVFVNGYVRQNGTYVQPHMRTAPNNNAFDNYSTKGNINPYNGNAGNVNPYQIKPAHIDQVDTSDWNE